MRILLKMMIAKRRTFWAGLNVSKIPPWMFLSFCSWNKFEMALHFFMINFLTSLKFNYPIRTENHCAYIFVLRYELLWLNFQICRDTLPIRPSFQWPQIWFGHVCSPLIVGEYAPLVFTWEPSLRLLSINISNITWGNQNIDIAKGIIYTIT